MRYTERVEHALRGCEAVSTGICPGCDECRDGFTDYEVYEVEVEDEYRYSFKASEGRTFATEEEAEAAAREAFDDDVRNGHVEGEAGFSWSECDICGSRLGGDREDWHCLIDGKLRHFSGACVDCVQYLANGTLPEEENA